jgi:hypothetical protein
MNQSSHPRFVIGLILLAVLCTVALGLQERRSAPLQAYSPASPVEAGPGPRAWTAAWERIGTPAFWLRPWPWMVVGLIGFGLLAWGLIWGIQRMDRNR